MINTHSIINVNDLVFEDFTTSSKSILMRDFLRKIHSLAKMDINVVLVGEIGSGKKQLAKVIHDNSKRSKESFYPFYCVDIDETEYQSAFWGKLTYEEQHLVLKYEALENAINGTLFLDQFSELSPKMMESIVESYIKGCNQLFRYNSISKPRLVLSINQETYQDILNASLWKRLLDKLSPVVIMIPPLRERKEDIPSLIASFLEVIKSNNKAFGDLDISAQALSKCMDYSWPGNMRQLKNAIVQGAILSYGKTIECEHLPFTMNWRLPYEIKTGS